MGTKEKAVIAKIFRSTALLIAICVPNCLVAACVGDINQDGSVNGLDFAIMRQEMGRNDCSASPCKSDLNSDGVVDDKDKEILSLNTEAAIACRRTRQSRKAAAACPKPFPMNETCGKNRHCRCRKVRREPCRKNRRTKPSLRPHQRADLLRKVSRARHSSPDSRITEMEP